MMLAHLDWSSEVAPIRNQLRLRKREPTPSEREALDREPELTADVEIGLKAFNAGSSCRALGYGIVGPIPQTAIDAWCDRFGLDFVAADLLSDALRYVDNAILEREAAKRRAQTGGR